MDKIQTTDVYVPVKRQTKYFLIESVDNADSRFYQLEKKENMLVLTVEVKYETGIRRFSL